MSPPTTAEITLPQVKIDFEDLLTAIRHMDETRRARIAQVLLESRMDKEFDQFLSEISGITTQGDLSDADIQAEVIAVRSSNAVGN